ncbi:unnamed protein product [Mytilus coruscus]|uniref:Uncharacterized protein n=1 Tax=Mytilus coruscus TaxID=42192 RepID=A0A6J8CF66_MYTCO|nr:unnamed protein product [Mytilus coruscus]
MTNAMIHIRGDKKSEKTPDKKATTIDDDFLRLDDEDSILFDKPKEYKTRSKISKTSSKPAAQGKAPFFSLKIHRQELSVDLGSNRGIAQLTLMRRRRTTARKHTTVLRTSYLMMLLRSTLSFEEEQGNQNQQRSATVPSTDSRKQKKQWPPTDDRRWEIFDKDLDKILGNTLTGDVHRKISSLSTIMYAVGQERFGVSNTKTREGIQGTTKHNRRQQEVQTL